MDQTNTDNDDTDVDDLSPCNAEPPNSDYLWTRVHCICDMNRLAYSFTNSSNPNPTQHTSAPNLSMAHSYAIRLQKNYFTPHQDLMMCLTID